MLILRSLAFNVAFYVNLLIWLVVVLPAIAISGRAVLAVAKAWGRSNLRLMRAIVGTRVEVRGAGNIPPGGLLVAAKHQSFWETFTLLLLFDRPSYVLKRELTWIPVFGSALVRAGMVPIDRSAGGKAIVGLNEAARDRIADGHQIIIFPEGTRRAPGAPPAYKQGVAHLYSKLDVPCVPVALNSGLFWPRRRFLRRAGTIVLDVLPPIPPGLPRDRFMSLLQERVETASDRLLAEARAEPGYTGPEGI